MSDRQHRSVAVLAGAALVAGAALLPTAAAQPTNDFPTDEYGYSGSAARCDDEQTLVEFGRTSRALVAICIDSDGQLEYRGVRLSDEATLTMPATRAADGTVTATNDGVTYAVTPKMILVSEGDTVLYRDAWTEFREPRFSASAPTTSTTPSTSSTPTTSTTQSSATPSSASTTPPSASATTPATVSTTTVTLTPSSTQ